ncbi:MAG: peptidase M22 [Ruminococcaceae bacterium]|nr:peptidase M22 [Oscillospiraceae bacterium]
MAEACYIGIDTSNYTTSVAVADASGRVIANLKSPLPVKVGERGLRQSDAVFAHTKNLPGLLDRLGEVLQDYTPVAVGVSARPRDAADSYMPCFLSGLVAAHAMAAERRLPIYEFSHQNGHIMAALYGSGAPEDLRQRPFGAFHVSGGTTEMVYVTPTVAGFDVSLCGEGLDLHAGQAVDRIGVAMGLSFPAGPALELLAMQNDKPIPPVRVSVKDGSCHLSGLENLALKLYAETEDKPLVAAFVLRFLTDTLHKMALHLRERYPTLPLVFAGGVMSNRLIAAELRRRLPGEVYFSEPAFSADNAAGIALLCRAAAEK